MYVHDMLLWRYFASGLLVPKGSIRPVFSADMVY